jgi:hypothetical protein
MEIHPQTLNLAILVHTINHAVGVFGAFLGGHFLAVEGFLRV